MIKGSIVALVTPFCADGKVNYLKLKELLQFHIDNNTDGVLLFGTTGEGSTLSIKEKIKIAKYSIKYVKKKMFIILNAGTNSTKETIKNVTILSKLKPDAFLIITPYYNKGNEEGIYNHFKLIQYNSKIPIILYNVPTRTTIDMSVSLIKRLSLLPNICGIKEASTNKEKLIELAKIQNDEFYWYSGNDNRMIEDIQIGAKGLIGVATNSHPSIVNKVIKLALENKSEEALLEYSRIKKYIDVLNLDVNPIMIKESMNVLNFNVGDFRLPLYKTSKDNKLKLIKAIREMTL